MRKALIATMAVLILGTGAVARPPEEAILGEVAGGLIGSFAGMYLGLEASVLLRNSFPNDGAWGRKLSKGLVFGGILAGACGGVALAGTLLGVDGNLPLCLLSACLGVGVGALLSIPIYSLAGIDLDLLLIPVAAVSLAVWGFNYGATSQ
ncbi:MAG: hypothetical protein NTX69_06930 [Candidatus Bipolaricaulota bacterium]|nr:hypothetical protein [Candidatus Bipolaricaulota bacterium]